MAILKAMPQKALCDTNIIDKTDENKELFTKNNSLFLSASICYTVSSTKHPQNALFRRLL
jgi:hypothetical protein